MMEWIIIYATLLDIIMGDPRSIPHPVGSIAKAIQAGESMMRRYFTSDRALKWAGVGLAIIIVGGSFGFFWGVLWLAYNINHTLGMGVSIILMSQALAINSLYKHAQAVARPLLRGDLTAARQALSMIVGRDTDQLDENEIIRGTVESVAENTVDGIVSPLFYGFIGGPALALAYKAVNTLDSMIGYKDERYINLGWAAARLDDLANYIPARLTALFFLTLAPFTSGGWQGVWRSLRRDARQHPSPNSGFSEAAVAGSLGIQLGGKNYYRGVVSERALMGEKKRPLEPRDIKRTLVLMILVSGEMLLLGIGLSICLR
jgi:adenosylcobinamide-phosphate synthase